MKPQPVVAPKKKLRHPKEKILAVNFCLPEARSDAPQGKKMLPGQPRRGTRMDRPLREQDCPQSSIGKWWNNRMAFAQIFGDGMIAPGITKINHDARSADVLADNIPHPAESSHGHHLQTDRLEQTPVLPETAAC
jgi:hypothetical protein